MTVKLIKVKSALYDRSNLNDTCAYIVAQKPFISIVKLGLTWAAIDTFTKTRVASSYKLKDLQQKLNVLWA